MRAAYVELHRLRHAHSIEIWRGGELVGGLYGVRLGGVFFGESMFSRERDASKVALAHLVAACRPHGIALIDCQMPSRAPAQPRQPHHPAAAVPGPAAEHVTRPRPC